MNQVLYVKSAAERRNIVGLDVCSPTYADALALASEMASLPIGQTVISFLNANNANIMRENPAYHRALTRQIVFPDGVGVDIASFLVYGKKFPANLNGTDFVPALLTYMERPKRVGLLGARADILEKAVAGFKEHAPWHEFVPVGDGYFDAAQSEEVAARIKTLKLDVLLVALSSPKQEIWVDTYIRPEHARLVVTVGALFDFAGKAVPRAPRLVRKLRMEWVFRLLIEPKRLWRRYIVGNPLFLCRAMKQAVLYRLSRRGHPGSRDAGSLL